jgi:hypothetical protein
MENEIMKDAEAKKILDDIKEKVDLSQVEDMIKNNYFSWKDGEIEYRVRLLNREDRDALYLMMVKKLNCLLEDIEIKKESELKEIYKEKRGIDIDDIDKQIKKLEDDRFVLKLKIGQAISENVGESVLVEYKNQVEEITESIQKIGIQRDNLLAHSMEKLLEAYDLEVKTWLTLEKKVEDNWIRLFSTFDEFRKCEDDNLITKAAHYNMLIQLR